MIRSQKVLPRLARQIAEEGDAISDLTVAWPKSRKVVDLGVLTLIGSGILEVNNLGNIGHTPQGRSKGARYQSVH